MSTYIKQKETSAIPPGISNQKAGKNLHVQIREKILRDIIASGAQAGERFCTETELAQQMNVCRNTIRKAMSELENEGYISRRRRVGTIIGDKISTLGTPSPQNNSQPTPAGTQRQRMIVTLPRWDDSTDGFFSSKILRHLISPEFDLPLSVEIRHPNDRLDQILPQDTVILAFDPLPEMILQLKHLSDQGARIITVIPRRILPGVVNICMDSRQAVYDAVQNFYAMGHQKVGILNHIQDHYDFRECQAGFLRAHRDLNTSIDPNALIQLTDQEHEITPDVTNITAWVCTYLAAVKDTQQECRKHSLNIPQDVSVVCMDDPIDEGIKILGKRLSVIRPDSAATATAIRNCILNWQDDLKGKSIVIPLERIDRETTIPLHKKSTTTEQEG